LSGPLSSLEERGLFLFWGGNAMVKLMLCQLEGRERYTPGDLASRLDSSYQEIKRTNARGSKDQFDLQFDLLCTALARSLGARCFVFPETVVLDWTGEFEHTDMYAEMDSSSRESQ